MLKREGVYEKYRKVIVRRLYSFDENIFDVIDSEEKAYWLGFLYADGYNLNRLPSKNKRAICRVGLTLASRDEEHVKRFRSFMQYTGPFRKISYKRGKAIGINMHSRYFSDHLVTMGVMPNKTIHCLFPSEDIVPKRMVRHFIRGYFDGDGCIAIRLNRKLRSRPEFEIRIVGTNNMMTEYAAIIRRELNIRTFPFRVKGKQLNIRNVRFGGNRASQKFLDWLYHNASVYLNRKYLRYSMLCELNSSPRKARGSKLGYPNYYDKESTFRYV